MTDMQTQDQSVTSTGSNRTGVNTMSALNATTN